MELAYRKVEGESAGGYLVDHSSNTYIVAPDGSLHSILPHAAAAATNIANNP